MRRWVVTGPPGAGKTSTLAVLAVRGYRVVPEAASDFIALRGFVDSHWEHDGFLAGIAALQRERQLQAADTGDMFFDRSPICTLALARHLGLPVPVELALELKRIQAASIYERRVLYLEWLGYLTPTAIRRIDEEQTRAFDRVQREV